MWPVRPLCPVRAERRLLTWVAGLRIANARLRELLAERDTQVTALAGQLEEQRVLIGS